MRIVVLKNSPYGGQTGFNRQDCGGPALSVKDMADRSKVAS